MDQTEFRRARYEGHAFERDTIHVRQVPRAPSLGELLDRLRRKS